MKSDAIKMDRKDVKIVKLDVLHCAQCDERATHRVIIDLRNLGQWTIVGDFCEGCAKGVSKRIKQSLP